MTTKINNLLSKGTSVKLKVAEDKSSKWNYSTEYKESLVQSIDVDTRHITYNRLQLKKRRKKRENRRKEV